MIFLNIKELESTPVDQFFLRLYPSDFNSMKTQYCLKHDLEQVASKYSILVSDREYFYKIIPETTILHLEITFLSVSPKSIFLTMC